MKFRTLRRAARARSRLWHVSGRWLIAVSVAVAVGLWALAAGVLVEMRRADWEQARQSSENIVSTIEADIARNIEVYDLSLRAVIENLMHPEINYISKSLRQLVLFDRAATAKHLGRIHVLDDAGRAFIDSRTVDPPAQDYSQRDYFRAHVRDPNAGMYVGNPFTNATAEYVVGVSRRLSNPDGSFGGVVAGTLRLSFAHDLFRKVKLGPDSALGLMKTDGTLLMRLPFNIDDIGRKVPTTTMSRQASMRSGHFETTGTIDGIHRLYVYRQVANLPLLLIMGTSTVEIYSAWHQQAFYIGIVALVLGLATIGLALFAAGELRRRNLAEKRLKALATTDGLTGLSNRRTFDHSLQKEWSRAARQGKSLAVLMIDADHFKSYNDRCGHQAGDKALIAIARAIAANVRADLTFQRAMAAKSSPCCWRALRCTRPSGWRKAFAGALSRSIPGTRRGCLVQR